jgi:hypothetical protein
MFSRSISFSPWCSLTPAKRSLACSQRVQVRATMCWSRSVADPNVSWHMGHEMGAWWSMMMCCLTEQTEVKLTVRHARWHSGSTLEKGQARASSLLVVVPVGVRDLGCRRRCEHAVVSLPTCRDWKLRAASEDLDRW